MSKYTVSKLNSIDELGDTDLLLVSRDNGDGTYSSVNTPFSTIAATLTAGSTGSTDSSDVGDGVINYFSPTTKMKVTDAAFYDAKISAALLFSSTGSQYAYIKDTVTIYPPGSNNGLKLVKYMPAAGNLPKNIYKDGDRYVAPDLNDTYTNDVALSSGDEVLSEILTFTNVLTAGSTFDIISSDTDINHQSLTVYKVADKYNELTGIIDATKQQLSSLYKDYLYVCTNYAYIKALDKKIYNNAVIIKGKKTTDKTMSAKNTPVYTDELLVEDDSVVYIYGSFTCDSTSNKGESYYFEIQVYCDLGDQEWIPIYRQYSTQTTSTAANGRTSINYQLFAKAGTRIRGYIAPQGTAGNIYYNLSNFSFTQAIINGNFSRSYTAPTLLTIPIQGFMSEDVISRPALYEDETLEDLKKIKGYWAIVEGAFSYWGSYNDSNDKTNNLYFACSLSGSDATTQTPDGFDKGRTYVPFHTVTQTSKNGIYSTYEYFMPYLSSYKDDDKPPPPGSEPHIDRLTYIRMFSANKVGNNSNYAPYGSNAAKVTYRASYDALEDILTNNNLNENPPTDEEKYKFDATVLNFDAVKVAKVQKGKIAQIAVNYNSTTQPSGRVGVSRVGQKLGSTEDNSLFVAWRRDGLSCDLLENATGAQSLYWLPSRLMLNSSDTNKLPVYKNVLNVKPNEPLNASMKISNNLELIRVSDAKKADAIYTAQALTAVSKFGSSLEMLDDYCFYKCGNLLSVAPATGVTAVGDYAFAECSSLTGTVSLSSVTQLGSNTFINCKQLNEIDVRSFAEAIPDKFAYKCSSLVSVNLSNAASIGQDAFTGTTVQSIGPGKSNGTSDYTVTANKLTSISQNAFSSCSSLTTVNLTTCTYVGKSAFTGCKSLKSLSVTAGTNKIVFEQNAFAGCPLIGDIQLGVVSAIGNGAFSAADKKDATFIFANSKADGLPELKAINAFPNNNKANGWKIRFTNSDIEDLVQTDKVWRQFKDRIQYGNSSSSTTPDNSSGTTPDSGSDGGSSSTTDNGSGTTPDSGSDSGSDTTTNPDNSSTTDDGSSSTTDDGSGNGSDDGSGTTPDSSSDEHTGG